MRRLHAADAPASRDVETGPLAVDYPDIHEVTSSVRFAPSCGRLWLGDQRMVMVHADAFSELRRELIEKLGLGKVRELFTRNGFHQGARDAELIRKKHPATSPKDLLIKGPQIHAIQGFVGWTPIRAFEWDTDRGRYYMDASWTETLEAEAHVSKFGVGTTAACWMATGVASGYATLLFGRPVLYREVECRALGHARCRVIGKALSDWDDADEDLKYFQIESFVNSYKSAAASSRPAPQAAGTLAAEAPSHTPVGRDLVGASAGFTSVVQFIRRVAPANTTVLFLGESGVGKEVFARALHQQSRRADKPFIAVNCAAIPENLMEAELFGVEKGAYTGASESRAGRFERAAGGTLFLDEIGTLSLPAQAKLLRVLQEGEYERVGGRGVCAADARVVAATNVDLRAEVDARRFRADLFYRISAFPIEILPLRERRSDIPLLVDLFLKKMCERHGKAVSGFTERAYACLWDYDWPGNVRELENLIERGVILAPDDGPLDVHHLFRFGERVSAAVWSPNLEGALAQTALHDAGVLNDLQQVDLHRLYESVAVGKRSLVDAVADIEKVVVDKAVAEAKGNLSQAARTLGMSRGQLVYRLERYSGDRND